MTKEETYKRCRIALVSICEVIEDNYNKFVDSKEMIERIKGALNKAPVEHWEELDD